MPKQQKKAMKSPQKSNKKKGTKTAVNSKTYQKKKRQLKDKGKNGKVKKTLKVKRGPQKKFTKKGSGLPKKIEYLAKKAHRDMKKKKNETEESVYESNRKVVGQLDKLFKRGVSEKLQRAFASALNVQKPADPSNVEMTDIATPITEKANDSSDINNNNNNNNNNNSNNNNNNNNNSNNNNNNNNDNTNINDSIDALNSTSLTPGTVVFDSLPKRLNVRRWKQPNEGHHLLFDNHTGKEYSFEESLDLKNNFKQMKSVEQELRDEIRADIELRKNHSKMKQKIREANQLKGMVVTPIRNMSKLRKFTKKQWKSVIKMSVDIKKPNRKNTLRNGKVTRVNDTNMF